MGTTIVYNWLPDHLLLLLHELVESLVWHIVTGTSLLKTHFIKINASNTRIFLFSGSVEMNDQSSIGSAKEQSRAVSVENDNRTTSISSDEGVQPLPPDKSPVSQKSSFKYRIFGKTPNTLSVQPLGNLGQSLPNLVSLGSPNVGTLSLSLNQNTLSVPKNNGAHLLSPTSRGISYPPPSPTRGNLRRGLAISQGKNPPLIKTRHVNSTTTASTSGGQVPASFDFDVPVIAGEGVQCL